MIQSIIVFQVFVTGYGILVHVLLSGRSMTCPNIFLPKEIPRKKGWAHEISKSFIKATYLKQCMTFCIYNFLYV